MAVEGVIAGLAKVIGGLAQRRFDLGGLQGAAVLLDDERSDARGSRRGHTGPGGEEVAGVVWGEGSRTEDKVEDEAGGDYRRDSTEVLARQHAIAARRCQLRYRFTEVGVGRESGEIRGAQCKPDGPGRRDGKHSGRLRRYLHDVLCLVEIETVIAGGCDDDHSLLIGVCGSSIQRL